MAGHTLQSINADHTHLPAVCGGTGEKWVELAGLVSGRGEVRYLEHRHLRYLYRPSLDKFVLLRGLDIGHTPSALHEMNNGLLLDHHAIRLAYCSTILYV